MNRRPAPSLLAAALAALLCAPLLSPPPAPAAEALFKTCPKCATTLAKPAEAEVKFCYGCGADLSGVKYRRKTEGELVAEAVAQKLRELGEPKLLTAEEWYRRGDTSEDEIVKMACFRQSLRVRDDARVRSNLGALLDKRGLAEAAEAEFRRAVELDDAYAIGHNNLGKVLLERRRFDEARVHFDRATALEPDNRLFAVNRADLLSAVGDRKAAESIYREVLKADPDSPAGRIAAFKLSLIAPEKEPVERPSAGKEGGDDVR